MCMDRAIMGQTLIKILRNEVDLAIYKQLLMYVQEGYKVQHWVYKKYQVSDNIYLILHRYLLV